MTNNVVETDFSFLGGAVDAAAGLLGAGVSRPSVADGFGMGAATVDASLSPHEAERAALLKLLDLSTYYSTEGNTLANLTDHGLNLTDLREAAYYAINPELAIEELDTMYNAAIDPADIDPAALFSPSYLEYEQGQEQEQHVIG